VSSWDYVGESWAMRETSPEPGGIPAVFLLKTLIPVAAINLALQGAAEVLRSALILVEGEPQ
jgi:TRAP-type mannitol/chloroaromatic compound transport system permease small subunit